MRQFQRTTPALNLIAVALLSLLLSSQASKAEDRNTQRGSCTALGSWYQPRTGENLSHEQLIAGLTSKAVVLLGEQHDNAEHHRWQLSVLAGLHAQKSNIVLGFESFPRKAQSTLDTWIEGELTTVAFLDEVRWPEIWGFDPNLYQPLFDFARLYRLPMIALNVERALISRVSNEGWAAISADDRQGVGDPAPASEAYLQSLAKVYLEHSKGKEDKSGEEVEKKTLEDVLDEPEFQRFVEAQLTWDRAMAEALAAAYRKDDRSTVIGIIGAGHLEHGYGVPHQLADLGITDVAILLPMNSERACKSEATVADALFVVEERPEPQQPRPRLGVFIETAESGVRIRQVTEGSVAEAAALKADDIIRIAAGFELDSHQQLIEIVGRQAPGTWLPLTVDRGDQTLEIVAKFPMTFE